MRFLYVFPHPDDESFGPALAIAKQRRQGHEVHLLTLTRGGATRQRHRLGLSVEQMGEVRYREMQRVAEVLDLSHMTVLDLPDSGLKDLDPLGLEEVVRGHIDRSRPDVLVTYPTHGVSGFQDHLVTHAVVKRVFCELRAFAGGADETLWAPHRLAFFTLRASEEPDGIFRLQVSNDEEIDCVVEVAPEDLERARAALACYETYRETIAEADPLRRVGTGVCFEIFGESHQPPLDDLTAGLSVHEG